MLYISTKRDDKYGVIDSEDAEVEYFDHDSLCKLLNEHPNLVVYGASKHDKFWFFKIYQPNFSVLVDALRKEFGFIQEVDERLEYEGKRLRIKGVGRWESITVEEEIGGVKTLAKKWKPTDDLLERLNKIIADCAEKQHWKISYVADNDRWLDFCITVEEFPNSELKQYKRLL